MALTAATPAALAEPTAASAAAAPLLVRKGDRLNVPSGSPLRARLTVAPIDASSVTRTERLPAVVEADPAAVYAIVPPATGRLVSLHVTVGDSVKRGQLLAVIDAPDAAQAVADARKAADALTLAQRALARARGVREIGSNADKDVEAAESAVAQQVAERDRAEARLRVLGAGSGDAPGRLRLRAPASGAVTALTAAPGAMLNDASAALLTIANLDHPWVTANVPEGMIGSVRVGLSVAIDLPAYPDLHLEGKVASVSAVLDADTRRVKARIRLANPRGLLKPNLYATVTLAAPTEQLLQVPPSALLMNNDSLSVFVEVAPWTFVRRAVQIGTEDGQAVTVRSGLAPGERVVVRGGVLLND